MHGDHKLEQAVAFVAGAIRKHDLPQVAENELRNRVESYLGIGTLNTNLLQQEGDDETSVGFDD
jgi:hypothetical protein